MSDNGPQFACEKFTNFVNEWGFEHRLGSPGHQQTNGKAEAAVKDAKCLLQKAKESKGDLYFEVLAQQNTPTEAMGTSPAQARQVKYYNRGTRDLCLEESDIVNEAISTWTESVGKGNCDQAT